MNSEVTGKGSSMGHALWSLSPPFHRAPNVTARTPCSQAVTPSVKRLSLAATSYCAPFALKCRRDTIIKPASRLRFKRGSGGPISYKFSRSSALKTRLRLT